MDSKAFLQELLRDLEPLRQAHREITEEFYSRPRSPHQTVTLLSDRCYRELQGAIQIAQQVPYFVDVDRDLFQMITQQVADEARHYHLLAEVLEGILGQPLRREELRPVPLTLEQNRAMYDEYGRDIVERFASLGLGAEYMSAAINDVVIQRGEPEVARAYRQINRDENFHAKLGMLGVERYATTPERQEKARRAALRTAELHLQAYEQLFRTVRELEG
jgi:hypothetical protein